MEEHKIASLVLAWDHDAIGIIKIKIKSSTTRGIVSIEHPFTIDFTIFLLISFIDFYNKLKNAKFKY